MMKTMIVGAGAVGGYYGAMLARGGNELFFIARGERLASLRQKGLRIESFRGDFQVTVTAGEDGVPFGRADLILVCVKSYDLETSFPLFERNVGPETIIIPLQNGMESEIICARKFGESAVIGGVAFIGVACDEGGVIHHTAHGHITIGEMNGAETERVARIGAFFEKAGVRCRVSKNICRDIAAKMIWNVGFNALCALHDMSANELAADPELANQARAAMREWTAVAQAMSLPLTESMVEKNIAATLDGGVIIPSMLQDRRNGGKMESAIFNTYVVGKGEELKIATPTNRSIAERLAAL